MSNFEELDIRSREIFQKIVENYLETGEPMGSKSLTERLSQRLSPATIRNVMAELEILGLLDAPHISAGRLPTERGLRFFVDGILEYKKLSGEDQRKIDGAVRQMSNQDRTSQALYERTGSMLSEISKTASLVFATKQDTRLKHLDFVWLSNEQALVILVDESGQVDNRIFSPPIGMTAGDMQRAANFINAHIAGKTLGELLKVLEEALEVQSAEVDAKMQHLISIGRASLVEGRENSQLVVRGRGNLIEDAQSDAELELLRQLMDDLESKRDLVELLELSKEAEAVRVFIGSENKLFSLKSSSLVVSPYMNGEGNIIGAVGVIGPTRLNYARIVPMVSYTANLIGHLLENEDDYERG